MDISFFLRGLVIGFSIAAPVGPIGVLCITRTIARGRICGLASGLGAACADAVYGCVAAFGLTFISGVLVNWQTPLRVAGGVFLLYLGLRTFLAGVAPSAADAKEKGLAAAFSSTFLLTLTNPVTILAFTAVFAGLGLVGSSADYFSASALVLGVFSGSAAWWLLLSGGVGLFRSRFSSETLLLVNKVSGVTIAAFGAYAIYSVL